MSEVLNFPHGHWGRIRSIRQAVASVRPDVVVAHSTWAGFYSRIGPRLPARLCYQPHGLSFATSARRPAARVLYWAIERALAGRADVIVAITSEEERHAARLGARSVVRVPNISRASSDLPRGTARRVVTVGRISREKDPSFFIEVAHRVRAHSRDVSFVWIGEGSAKLTELLVHNDVQVTGWLERQQVWDLVASSTAYVHTAVAEGFPLTVLDSAALGTPIVLRGIPAFEELGVENPVTPAGVAEAVLAVVGGRGSRSEDLAKLVCATSTQELQAAQLLTAYGEGSARWRRP